jgi:gentisate 1,2-dioxygenase
MGGPVMPTIAAHVRHLPAGVVTRPRRSTDSTILEVVEGRSTARVEDQEFRLEERDILVVPSWRALTPAADCRMVLFGCSDRAAQETPGCSGRLTPRLLPADCAA